MLLVNFLLNHLEALPRGAALVERSLHTWGHLGLEVTLHLPASLQLGGEDAHEVLRPLLDEGDAVSDVAVLEFMEEGGGRIRLSIVGKGSQVP